MELQHKVYIEKRDTSILLSTTQLRGQVSNTIPELGTMSLPAVPNWLQSPLKPRAWLCIEMASSHDDYQPRVNNNESKDWAGSKVDSAQSMESSSNVRLANSKAGIKPTAPLSVFDKKNLIEFSLNSLLLIHFTTVAMCLLSHGSHVTLVMWYSVTVTCDVTICDCLSHTPLWHYDKVM